MMLSKLKQALLGTTLVLSSLVMQLNAQSSSPKRITVDTSSTTNSGISFSTIKMAVDSAKTGDTIIVKEGTYKEKIFFNSNYSNKKLILSSLYVIDGDTSHIRKTILSGAGITQNNANTDNLLRVTGNNRDSTYFQMTGFTVDSASKWALDIEGGLVRNCILKNSGSLSSIPFFFRGTKIRNTTVFNNIGLSVFGFQLIGTDAPFSIESSLFYNNRAVSSNSESDNRGGPWNQQGLGGIIYAERIKGKIKNNIFYNNSGDQILTSGGDELRDTIEVVNNTFYKNNTKTAYFINWWGGFENSMFATYWHNNIIDNNYDKSTRNTNSEFAWGDGGNNGKPSNYFFKNNLLAQEISTLKGSSNFSTTFTFTYDTASHMIGTAKFKDTANLDFSLVSTSLGIGAGTSSLALTKDFYGVTRPAPVGSGIDLGAIESDMAMPYPVINSVQEAVVSGSKAVKLTFSIPSNPKIDSVVIYRSTASRDTAIITSSAGTY